MNWNDPTERLELLERVGISEYNRMLKQHSKKSVVAIVNGYDISVVSTRFGRLFAVTSNGTTKAFPTQAEAEACANRQIPKR